MATHDYDIANQSGAAFRVDLNNVLDAIQSNNSNSSSPSTTVAYQWWADTSAAVMKLRNSANDGWIELFQLDGTLTLEDGTVSAPGLAFRDDLNTGIFSSAADTFDIATAGVARLQLDASETTFNEDGADTDFRIEGDTDTRLFFLEAGTNRIGIGVDSAPLSKLHVQDVEGTTLTLGNTAAAASDGDYLSGIDFHIKDNNDSTGATCASIRTFADQNHTASAKGTALALFTVDDDTTVLDERLRITHDGKVSTGAESSPDCCAGGITIQQNAENGNALTIKSTNVDHGVTDKAETDTYFTIQRASGTRGGAFLEGFTDAQSDDAAFEFMGVINSDTNSSSQVFTFRAGEKDGSTGAQNIASNRRIACFKNNDNTRCVSITPHGVTFGNDVEEANALDDYEEGTWTPAFTNVSAPTYTSTSGKYTKIGRFIFLTGEIFVASGLDTSDTSAIAIAGLPFPPAATHNAALFEFGQDVSLITQSGLDSFANVNITTSSLIALLRGTNNLAYSQCNSSGNLKFALSYET